MLYIIARMLDTYGEWSASLSNIYTLYGNVDQRAKTVSEQQVNGSYRSLETLYVLCRMVDDSRY